MSIRNLDSLLDPSSVVVIGASPRLASVGATVWRNMLTAGFKGPVMAVNPKYRELDGQRCYARVDELPQAPELAVICTPAPTVAALVHELGSRGTKAAVVLTAGLTASDKQAVRDAARPYLLRLLGPNCIGLIAPHAGLNASFSHVGADRGDLAFVSQSGALVTAMLDWARAQRIGFSQVVSLGEHIDVDFGDMLDFLATDCRTRAVLLYVESIESPRKFMSAARAAARNKPVIVVKSGRSERGQRAAASHTGALAGADSVYDAAISRAGMLRVDTLQDLFLAAETLTRFRANRSERLTILTNGGGAGVMAADAAARSDVPLAELSAETVSRLDAVLPGNWSQSNPVDIIGDAPVDRYLRAFEVLADDPQAGAVLFIHAPTAIVPSADIARAVAVMPKPLTGRLFSSWLGGQGVAEARDVFSQAGIAGFATPEDAVKAFGMLRAYHRNQEELIEAPPADASPLGAAAASMDIKAARQVIRDVLDQGRELLTEPEAKAVLQACGVPVASTRTVAADPQMAASVADEIGYPVVLKILSPEISHKSDVGGVVLGLDHRDAVVEAARSMLERVARLRPDARRVGLTVQRQVRRRHGQELIIGSAVDPVFGPVILFGQGGTAVELVADRAIALPPLNEPLARSLVARTRVSRLLRGWRDVPPADLESVHRTLIQVSQMLADLPELAEIDINPLIASPEGVVALDARIRVTAQNAGGAARFAIRPYPAELVETVVWKGRDLVLRPIRPDDELRHIEFLTHLDPEDIRLRIFYTRRTMERSELARLTQIDYTREMAFIAVAAGPDGLLQTLGVARAMTDPDNISAEFGVIVRSELKGGGLGRILMDKLIRYLRANGTRRLEAVVLQENTRMLEMARRLGLRDAPEQPEFDTRALVMDLQDEAALA